jgi:tRNA/rRNA methyltransferase
MDFSFILVEPAVAENVGAAARALKTMGFDRLLIVNSKAHLEPRARWVAHGSVDIMDNIKVFDTLETAVRDADLVIGTTAKRRRTHADYYPCTEIPRLIQRKAEMLENVAIVFGREESGLTNEELGLCHIFTGVPIKTGYPSLNLSQSVMIYAWELMRYSLGGPAATKSQPFPDMSARDPKVGKGSGNASSFYGMYPAKNPSGEKLRHLRCSVKRLLVDIGFDSQSAVYSRIMKRFEAVGDKDAGLLLSVCSRLDEMLPADRRGNNEVT